MALQKCRECGNRISTKAKACPSCGAPIKKRSSLPARGCATILVIFGIIVIVGLLNNKDLSRRDDRRTPSAPRQASSSQDAKRQASVPSPSIPLDVTYTIVDSDIMFNIKRSLDVRLNKRVPEDVLRAIALKLKSQASRSYKRTFICYYMPGMQIGAGAWATTHFDPNLDVQILGLTPDEERVLTQQPDDQSREIIGRWLDDRPLVANRITIFRQNSTLLMEQTFIDGTETHSIKKEVIEKSSTRGRRFEDKQENSYGEFYLINRQGHLGLWDQDGLISTARKIHQ